MVLALARRLLGNSHDAEDVLQATFLTLVRKAGTIGKLDSVASWLYKVGSRNALRTRAQRAARPVAAGLLEHLPAVSRHATPNEPALDQAILGLPAKYRSAIVLRYLEGKSNAEAAAQLRCPIGTVSARLTRARALLRKRLSRNGAVVPPGALTSMLSGQPRASIPAGLLRSALEAAVAVKLQHAALPGVFASVAALLRNVGTTAVWNKFGVGAALTITGLLLLTIGGSALRDAAPISAANPGSGPQTGTGQTERPASEKAPAPLAGSIVVTGRVLAPSGNPVAGAHLYYPRFRQMTDVRVGDYGETETPERGLTDADGRFRIELPSSDITSDRGRFLVAAADGYGINGEEVSKDKPIGDLTIRLV